MTNIATMNVPIIVTIEGREYPGHLTTVTVKGKTWRTIRLQGNPKVKGRITSFRVPWYAHSPFTLNSPFNAPLLVTLSFIYLISFILLAYVELLYRAVLPRLERIWRLREMRQEIDKRVEPTRFDYQKFKDEFRSPETTSASKRSIGDTLNLAVLLSRGMPSVAGLDQI